MTTMEDLTKTQIILLTLLVSFVTSIATGIITTSLLAEAPVGITQTINRVVEHTIEKVTPAPATKNGTTVKEVTVVKEDDAVTSSIAAVSPAIVRIKTMPNDAGPGIFYALGTIISKSGLVLSDKRDISVDGTVYNIYLADGTTVRGRLLYTSDADRLAIFQLEPDATHKEFSSATLATGDLKLGQTVISIAGKEKNLVTIGRAASLNNESVETDIPSSAETSGNPLLNLRGEIVGVKTSNPDQTLTPGIYTTLSPIRRILDKLK